MKVITFILLSIVCAGVKAVVPAPGGCNATDCVLPNCLCSSTNYPPPITDMSEYPQIVMLSFDDAVEQTLYDQYYSGLFDYVNPDGVCSIGMTFFLSHDYTDYTLVHDLWQRGYEIASHSITHQTPTTYWYNLDYNGWVNEMYGLSEIASSLANLPITDIVGARAPFLQIGGDTMMQALVDSSFQYDCSMPTQTYSNPPLFPYTFDYKSIQDCEIPPCPTGSYPGFWEVPLVDFNATYPCSMLDSCTGITGVNGTYQFLLDNFNKHYLTNKAPIGYFTHASWFETDPTHYPGYLQFLDDITSRDDVYIVSVKHALDWMRTPTKLVDLPSFAPWSCASLPSSQCPPTSCHYNQSTPGGERYMNACVKCPKNYPWLGDPYGNNTTT